MTVRYRLVARLTGKPVAVLLEAGANAVGSAAACAVRITHPSVSRRHAELWVAGGAVSVRDHGSRNGTYVDGQRVDAADLSPGAQLRFGRVEAVLEAVEAADAEVGITLEAGAERAEPGARHDTSTVGTHAMDAFAAERLPALLRLLLDGADLGGVATAVGATLFETLPVTLVEAGHISGADFGVLYQAQRGTQGAAPQVFSEGSLTLRVVFADRKLGAVFQPLVEAAGLIIALSRARDRRAAPVTPGPGALPEPRTVVPAVQRVYADAERAAKGDVGVLILGESGTGKDLLARFIHGASARAKQPFVALNCAALPRDLMEAELFGIERGVATGVDARPGKFELAHGGTLFLDEVGDMGLDTQARILRVLQEGEVFRIGGAEPRPADVRIVAATHHDLRRLIDESRFREDLYYRFATCVLELPPLRARTADVPNLASYFLQREAAKTGVHVKGISRAALELLVRYRWPGNIRQLEKEMSRAVLFLSGRDLLDTECLQQDLRGANGGAAPSLRESVRRFERSEIEVALARSAGDTVAAAAALGVPRSTLYRRMRELDIPGGD